MLNTLSFLTAGILGLGSLSAQANCHTPSQGPIEMVIQENNQSISMKANFKRYPSPREDMSTEIHRFENFSVAVDGKSVSVSPATLEKLTQLLGYSGEAEYGIQATAQDPKALWLVLTPEFKVVSAKGSNIKVEVFDFWVETPSGCF